MVFSPDVGETRHRGRFPQAEAFEARPAEPNPEFNMQIACRYQAMSGLADVEMGEASEAPA
ncbi:MAG: hypothetical protein NVSMB9_22240 [Isosphaeraceae bacterium]